MTNLTENAVFLSKIIQVQSRLTEAEFNLTGFMELVCEQMRILTPATGTVVELVEGDDMVYRAATGTVSHFLGLRLPIKNSISGLCVQCQQVLRSDDTELDPRVNLEACRKVSARSLVVAPLFYHGETVGVLKILSNKPHSFLESHMHILQLMAGFIASGLAHQLAYDANVNLVNKLKAAQEELYQLAHHDSLTNLINRRTFNEKLKACMAEAKENSSVFALMYLDIDHFKQVNDNLGHDIGDAVLKVFASRLENCIRKNDIVCRLGGDEFAIIVSPIQVEADAIMVANNTLEKMRKPFKVENHTLNITTSIGLTFYHGQEISCDAIIKQADNALYEAKETGRDMCKSTKI